MSRPLIRVEFGRFVRAAASMLNCSILIGWFGERRCIAIIYKCQNVHDASHAHTKHTGVRYKG